MEKTKEKYGLGRFINGICLNPLEFVLDDDGNVREFDSPEEVKQFAVDNGAHLDEFDDSIYSIDYILHVVRFKEDGEYEIL